MKTTRLWTITIAAAVLAVGAFATAVPSHAIDAVQNNGDGTATVTWSGGTSNIEIGPCGGFGSLCYVISNGTTSGSVTISEGDLVKELGTTVPLPAGVYDIKLKRLTTLLAQATGVQIGSGGGGGGTSSDAAASAPVEVSLALDLEANGASCKDGSAAKGLVGTWLSLPSTDDCSSTTRSGAKLLGWSTSANFPVAMAQSQVTKGWGAIDEVINGVRMIFIPAGQATSVSGPNSLYPIWAS